MKKYRIVMAVIAAALVAAVACTPQATKAPPRATKEKPHQFEKEGKIPPLKKEDIRPETDFEEMPVQDEEVVGEEVDAPVDTAAVSAPGPSGGPAGVQGKDGQVPPELGWRVQIFASANKVSAEEVLRGAQSRVTFPVYVDFVDNMYKVRVGDCRSRLEAEKVRARCQAAGYKDAWIVGSPIQTGGAEKR